MIDESCKVPRENLDDGFNPCRRQVVENGELCQYAHMYDVMNERYDREEDTSYLNSVKRDRITQSTPNQTVGEGKLYAQSSQGVEGFIKSSGTLDPTTHAEIPSSKAVADYAPIPLPVSKGGTGGNTPYVTDDLDASAIFVMHDAPNDRYDAAPMSALTGYLDGRYDGYDVSVIPNSTDLNTIVKPGKYGTTSAQATGTIVNKPDNITHSFLMEIGKANGSSEIYQRITELVTFITYERTFNSGSLVFNDWTLLYPTSASAVPLPADQSGTGALVYNVDSNSTYLRAISGQSSGNQNDLVDRAGIQAMIDAAVANLAAKTDLENYVQKSTDTSAHGQVYAVTKDGEQTMENIVVHLVES